MMVWNCERACGRGDPSDCKQFLKHVLQQYDRYRGSEEAWQL